MTENENVIMDMNITILYYNYIGDKNDMVLYTFLFTNKTEIKIKREKESI